MSMWVFLQTGGLNNSQQGPLVFGKRSYMYIIYEYMYVYMKIVRMYMYLYMYIRIIPKGYSSCLGVSARAHVIKSRSYEAASVPQKTAMLLTLETSTITKII